MRKTLLSGALTIMLLIGIVAPAFAWTNLGDYWPTQSYTPNHGNKWGQIVRSGNRYLDVDTDGVYWDNNRTNWVKNNGNDPAIVFHIFQQNTNCGQQFNFTGYWWSDAPGVYKQQKWADCTWWTSGPNNELRIYTPRNNIVAWVSYDFGGEFVDQGGGSLNGEANYDTYYGSNKQWMAKWYFEGNDNLHN
jgi:hypothetical protein